MTAAEPNAELLYGQICASHAGIADFRAKLLALLPIASGAGIFLLLNDKVVTDGLNPSLMAAGLFGFVVTLGLFLYELRGIEDCVMLRGRAAYIERTWLHVSDGVGHYLGRKDGRLRGLVSEIGAGWVVYVSVMAAWLYVAGVGWDASARIGRHWAWPLAALALAVIALGVTCWEPEREKLPDA